MRAFSTKLNPNRGAGAFASLSASAYGRTPAYRRIPTRIQQYSQSSLDSRLSTKSLDYSFLSPFALRSSLQPHDVLSRTTALYGRHFHSRRNLAQEPKLKDENRPNFFSGQDAQKEAGASEKATSNESTAEEAKPESETKSSSAEGEQKDGEGEQKEEGKKAEPPPPPPHGDKTPWQVFTETLQSEFKASKEWNESTKALSSGYNDFTQNETIKKVRSGYSSASDAAASTTSAALKTTGKTLGQAAAWTWDTPVVKGVRKGVSAAGSGIEKITRPVRETEAYKNVKDVIDDGSSSRYGGWAEKEERRARREALERKSGRRSGEKMEEDPNAGTNVTLHKDAAWKEQWRDFRDSSRLMQSIFSLRSTYRESENPLVTTARSISDRVAGFFAENETAMVIKKFREMDPGFQLEPFLQEMREYILPEVLDAYVKGDVETLKLWLSAPQYQVYAALMQQYTTAGLKSDGKILDIRHVDILSARLLDPGEVPVFILTARTQEVHTYRNIKSGELAAGMDDKVQQVTYAIGVTRVPEDVNNPETRGWRLIELQKSARDYI
ncbi:Tim44-like domain-containing protein [Rhizodiscina lignyota]|uniref:Mitochondrial import inner membrane translocase subunit TIM44 n=1 Tax=Rhizodiscina lignyota TaxID=1504668 RepID=A0A9P4M6C2_9PEZI|nr:Tim44-like domain-containing protein [Rhizodiscina lignyota]